MDHEDIFPHKCIVPDCDVFVQFDDEPWCFEHSPDEGSTLIGYSARRAAEEKTKTVSHHNIFKETDP